MREFMIALAAKTGLAILQAIAKAFWESLWAVIFEVIEQAEINWRLSGSGELKKAWARDKILKYLDEKVRPKRIQRWFIEKYIDKIIDIIINDLNKTIGHTWVDQAGKLKDRYQKQIPFIN